MTIDLRDKVAIVTGAGRGIGREIATTLAREGVKTVVTDIDREYLTEVKDEFAARSLKGQQCLCDVSDSAQVQEAVDRTVKEYGRIDILVNNAGVVSDAPLDRLTEEQWDATMGVNLKGTFLMCKAVAPVMKAQGRGRIVNISSVAGLGPSGSSIAYAVSKAGLIHLTRCMAVAMAPETLVNCVAPGLLEGTRATANLRAEQVERSASSSLLKKPADKDDCADMVVTMCRTETMTGQTIVIDSGRVFH